MISYNRIIIFGFSGSGKSTISEKLAKKYQLRIIHPSGIIRDILGKKKLELSKTQYNKGFWETKKGILLLKSRLNKKNPVDLVVDKILLNEIKKGNIIIDSWNLPWLTESGLKIYLKADLDTRAIRVSKRDNISFNKTKKIISEKDNDTIRLFKRIYNIDIGKDHEVFDLIINTKYLSRKQTFSLLSDYLDILIERRKIKLK